MFWVMNSVYGRSLALATADDSPADEPRNCPGAGTKSRIAPSRCRNRVQAIEDGHRRG